MTLQTLEELAINCPHCGKAYKSEGGLNYHVKFHHRQNETEANTVNLNKHVLYYTIHVHMTHCHVIVHMTYM